MYASNLRGLGRVARGLIIGLTAVVSTAVAHYTATGHVPEPETVLLALTVAIPVCIGLSRVPRSRGRLVSAVLTGQVFLHLLFGPGPAAVEDHQHPLLIHLEFGALSIHVVALVVTYAAIRRGDELVEVLYLVLGMSLFQPLPGVIPRASYPACVAVANTIWAPVKPRPGEGPTPLRGPPELILAS